MAMDLTLKQLEQPLDLTVIAAWAPFLAQVTADRTFVMGSVEEGLISSLIALEVGELTPLQQQILTRLRARFDRHTASARLAVEPLELR